MASCLRLHDMLSRIIKEYTLDKAVLLLFVLSCHNPGHPADQADNKTEMSPPTAIKHSVDTIFAGSTDTTIRFNKGEIFIKGHISANKHQPHYTIPGLRGQTITAIIRPSEKGGNVRINQIQQPGGAFDGPFGDSLSYTFKRDGNIQFIIGENLMAGDPYTGDFVLRITLAGP